MPLERVSTLITDEAATQEELEPFRSAGVRVISAPVDPADRLLDQSRAAG